MVASLALGGCAFQSETDDAPAAKLNAETGSIVMPIDTFLLSDGDMSTLISAREAVVAPCMAEGGIATPKAQQYPVMEDRPYGLWNVQTAREYGFTMPTRDSNGRIIEEESWDAGITMKEQEVHEECTRSLNDDLDDVSPPNEMEAASLSTDIKTEARIRVSDSDDYEAIRSDWVSCLESNGLSVDPSANAWTSNEAMDLDPAEATGVNSQTSLKRREIDIATTEAECNKEVGVTQKLSDLEAVEQAGLVREHEAALASEKEDLDARVDRARTVLSNAGER